MTRPYRVRTFRPPQHARPANTSPARLAAQVRGVLVERMNVRLTDLYPTLTAPRPRGGFGLTDDEANRLFFLVMAQFDAAEFADDPHTAAVIAALGKPELVPVTGLERCGERQLRAYLDEPEPAPADDTFDPAEVRDLIQARTARLAKKTADPLAGLRRLLADARGST